MNIGTNARGSETNPRGDIGAELMDALDLAPRARNPVRETSVNRDDDGVESDELDQLDDETNHENDTKRADSSKTEDIPDDDGTDVSAETDDVEGDEGGDPLTPVSLAKDYGVDPETVYKQFMVPGPDGKLMSLGELKDLAQSGGSGDIKAERAQFEQERETAAQELKQAYAKLSQHAEAVQQYTHVPEEIRKLETQLAVIHMHESATNWEEFEADDPGRAALARQQFAQAKEQARSALQDLQGKYGQAQQENIRSKVKEMRREAVRLIPEWKDPKVVDSDLREMIALANQYGYQEGEVRGMMDPRMAKLVRDYAKLLSKSTAVNKSKEEVLRRGNPVLRAGGGRPQTMNRLTKTIAAAKKPNATKGDKFAAQKAILADAGII